MSRKGKTPIRKVTPDAKYSSEVVAKFVSRMMVDGKRSLAMSIFYESIDNLAKKTEKTAMESFQKALENVKPMVEVKSRRVGGATYQVPVEVRESRREALSMKWLIEAARKRGGKTMIDRLSAEFFDAYNSTGSAFKKKEDTHRMAEANKAFAHYRW